MNVTEAVEEAVESLNRIQSNAFLRRLCEDERLEWKYACKVIRENGFVPAKKRCIGSITWYAKKPNENHNNECEYVYTNVRPNRKTLNGDCTTRSLTLVLNGEMTYDEIEREQYALAKQYHTRRNTNGTWDKVIFKRGWCKIRFINAIKRSRLAAILKDTLHAPIISRSSGHVAVIDIGGIVRDIWDSRGGRVFEIYCKGSEKMEISTCLGKHGIALKIT